MNSSLHLKLFNNQNFCFHKNEKLDLLRNHHKFYKNVIFSSSKNLYSTEDKSQNTLISPIKKTYMIKVIREIFVHGMNNGISRIRHTSESNLKNTKDKIYNKDNEKSEENNENEKNENKKEEESSTNLKTSFEKLNISTKDLKAKSEEMIKLIKTNFDKYNLDEIFQILLIMHHFKIKDFDLMVKIEKRISNNFIDMKYDNQAKIIYYFCSLDYFSNKFYFLSERFLIKNIEALTHRNFLLIFVSMAKNPFLTHGLIVLLETYIEKKFNEFKINELVEIFINLSKIYERFSYFFDESKKHSLIQKVWSQLNTHFHKIPVKKLVDLYFMVFSIDTKKLKNKKHISELKAISDIENARNYIFQILNSFYINFYHRDAYEDKNKTQVDKLDIKSQSQDKIEENGVEYLLDSDNYLIDNLIKKSEEAKDDEHINEKRAKKANMIHKIILTHHFGDDTLFNFNEIYKKYSYDTEKNSSESKDNYSEKVDNKIHLILESHLPKLDTTDIATLFKNIEESHLMKVIENPKEKDINTEILKFNFFVYNEIIKNIEMFYPEEINAIFSILLLDRDTKKKFLFLNYDNNLAFLLDKFLEVTKKDYLLMSVEEQCLYLQTIYDVTKLSDNNSEELRKIKDKAKEIFGKIEKEIQEKRIKKLQITQVVPILDVYTYIGKDHFKFLDPTSLMNQILFLLENETSDNFDDLFDDYYHITLLMHDLMDEVSLLENHSVMVNDDRFWREFSKYSKLFMNSKKIDQRRLKKLFKLLDNKLNR